MQIFSRNPRQWRKSSLAKEDIKEFKKKVKAKKIDPVVIHIPYTLNLAATRKKFYKITIGEFITDLIEADSLGAQYLVTHMGSYKGGSQAGGLARVINALKKILKETKKVKTKILLENTSGAGCWLGYKFSDHRLVFESLDWTERLGVCLDTAHAWAAGYKINTALGVSSLLKEIGQEVGLKYLEVVHLNDTKEELDSRQDRHCNIGEGKIGRAGFKALVNHPKLGKVPFILETPRETQKDDLTNLAKVRKLYTPKK